MVENLVVVRGGGDLATGTIHRLVRCGFQVAVLEISQPTVIRRTVAFAQAVFDGETSVEGIKAVRVEQPEEVWETWKEKKVPVLIDSCGKAIEWLRPEIVIDAILAKKNMGTEKKMASIVVALGPGFTAGEDVHAVVETNRGHNLGRVIYKGSAEPDTGNPGIIGGYGKERIVRAPAAGKVRTLAEIGDRVAKGQILGYVEDVPIVAPLDGVLRGLIQNGILVENRCKIGDVDPRNKAEYCLTISDKARSISGGVLEAILYLRGQRKSSYQG